MRVVFPVIFFEEDDESYSVFVPDLNNISTSGRAIDEAMLMAEELIAGYVLDIIEEGKKIPSKSDINDLSYKKIEDMLNIKDWNYKSKFKSYIAADIDLYAKKWGKELVKKTVNIPKWINTRAEDLRINFSKTLEEALLEKIYNS